ncbi:MarR family transcriptional regulator [Natrinema sp. S1CR25-10]|uniref:MarR family transcriptional regulator n=1 Tax=Natrinema salsiterrestre TaxID=2950540 RepID=A0A9Q4L542_9EURY|nr:MarR family transcriptional regulator [Natrinema salsiterrestre]
MMSTSAHQLTIPDDVGSSQAKLVYLALFVTEEPTLSQLQRQLGLSKLTLLPILRSLIANEYVQRTEDGYVCQ